MPFVKVNGIELYYEATDFTRPWETSSLSARAETLVMLHGLHGSVRWWNYYQVAPLSQSYRIINVDLRGHGKSDKPYKGYSISQMASDISSLIEELGESQVHLMGASMGGMVSLQFALDFPEQLLSLVLVDSFPHTPDGISAALGKWIEDTTSSGYAKVMETFNNDYAEALFSEGFRRKFPDFLDMDTEEVLKNLMPDPSFIGCCRAIQEFDVRPHLTQISAPTLIITSDEGMGFHEAQEMQRLMPNANMWAPNKVGHSVQIEIPEEFNLCVLDFWRGLKGRVGVIQP
jgi:3-oxoadipate enol-lactonase